LVSEKQGQAQITEWLDQMHIGWYPCGEIADEEFMCGYLGSIYIDVPFDLQLPEYQKLAAYLENPDGTMRLENTEFCVLPISVAMKNAHHDEPGFWEKLLADF
jgi:hypothetical protein